MSDGILEGPARSAPLSRAARAADWMARHRVGGWLAVLLAVVAAGFAVATYAAFTGSGAGGDGPAGPDLDNVYLLLNIDLVLLLLLASLIGVRITGLWVRRRRGLAGSRLHTRLVALLGVAAAAPAIVIATFSMLLFHFTLQHWFSEQVRTAVYESVSAADAYLADYHLRLQTEILGISEFIDDNADRFQAAPGLLNQYVNRQARLRQLTEAVIFTADGETLARLNREQMPQLEPVAPSILDAAREQTVVLLHSETHDRVAAIVALETYPNTFMLVDRPIEPLVVTHRERTRAAYDQFVFLEERQTVLRIAITAVYIVVSLLLMLGAVWAGLVFADRLVAPISSLIAAADRVRAGDMTARVPADLGVGELQTLSNTFNRMTSQLEGQRRDLVDANRQLDERRRFTETVLAGVSAGVLGLAGDGTIELPNKSALNLLALEVDDLVGRPLPEVMPEVAGLLEEVRQRPYRVVEGQVQVRRGPEHRTLLVRISAERVRNEIRGFVATFDDITELLSAQRKAAWADVARRIAHEIKNPLTPIQLSAERLKRRYLKQITEDPGTFETCTDTIVRRVGDIGRMVDEFSAFARMPQPVFKPISMADLCRQAVVLQSGRADVSVELRLPEADLDDLDGDARLISQALTNLVQNAIDAIDGRTDPDAPPGHVVVTLRADGDRQVVEIADNGRGLPETDREKLTEPYVTTRAKGTGLGLAIVKKIMEEHDGDLHLADRPGGGAIVSLRFPAVSGLR